MFKAVVIGNLGNDPDLRYSASGAPLLRFNLAANYRTKNDQNEWTEKTEWVRCTVFGNRAESLGNLLKKGTKVYVEGRLEARPWTAHARQLAERLWRLDRVHEAISARYPRRCPSCGSKWIAPTFWPDASLDVWDCAEPECRAIFSGRGD
jgi:single-stranded DNA-binding protein